MERERRRELRMQADRPGRLVIDQPPSEIDCNIREVSLDGASIVHSGGVLPEFFTLTFAGDPVPHKCRLIWQKGELAGLEFIKD